MKTSNIVWIPVLHGESATLVAMTCYERGILRHTQAAEYLPM